MEENKPIAERKEPMPDSPEEKLNTLMEHEDGKYAPLLTAVRAKVICMECKWWNEALPNEERCKVEPICMANTISEEVNTKLYDVVYPPT